MEILPIEILNHIIFDYLYVHDIKNCLLACKKFHVLTDKQLEIYQNATLGHDHCFLNGMIDSLRLLSLDDLCSDKFNSYFLISCKYGYVSIGKYLLKKYSICIHQTLEEPLRLCCYHNQLEMAKWLFSLDNKFSLHVRDNELFRMSCEFGFLQFAQWLYSLDKTFFTDHRLNKFVFKKCCMSGHIDVVKWLYSINNKLCFIEKDPNDQLYIGCIHGHLELVKWLFSIYLELNIKFDKNYLFKWSCYHGQLHIAKWIYQFRDTENTENTENTEIDIRKHWKWLFIRASINGQLETIKWLYSLDNSLNIRIKNDRVFYHSCLLDHVSIVEWLASLCDKYEYSVVDGKIMDYNIN